MAGKRAHQPAGLRFNAGMSSSARDVYTVSRLNREVRAVIEGNFGALWLEGEISNLARPSSGHWYFTLKDPSAQVRCAMFRMRTQQVRFKPGEGSQVLVYARIGMYEPRGEFQLVVEHMEPAGEGLLRLQFEALKRKLATEGLFDAALKRPLPAWPRAVGVVTSPTGAAVRDILHVLGRRNPGIPVIVYPCAVQGAAAVPGIVAAIRAANRRAECDVLLVARGGGSLEDLWAFNEEAVVRAVRASDIPIVSGIGHEIDFTLTDFAADVRAPTPSAAAEICAPDRAEILHRFTQLESRMRRAAGHQLALARQRLEANLARLRHPGRRLEEHAQRLDELTRRLPQALQRLLDLRHARLRSAEIALAGATPARRLLLADARLRAQAGRLSAAMPALLERKRAALSEAERTLRAIGPQATLDRGYAIVTTRDGAIVRDAGALASGDALLAQLARGRVNVLVASTEPGRRLGGEAEPDST
jgi:exodeoxyribonuclease VII large subunit